MNGIPTSTQITLAQAQRQRRRRGVFRLKVIGGIFSAAFVFGLIGGFLAPGS